MSVATINLYDEATRPWLLAEGDSFAVLPSLRPYSLDAVICDPPYGISFHAEAWDQMRDGEAFERWTQAWTRLCLPLLKPGGHLLAFGAPRTFHRLVAGVEDAGFEIRDQLLWVHGQGVPKSRRLPCGLGSSLKPAYEPILIARKPFRGATVANVGRYGTGALNIDAARVPRATGDGYWPATLALSHHPDCPVGLLDGTSTEPSRLFYCAKATSEEREAGCGELPIRATHIYSGDHHRPRLARNHHPTVKPLELMRWLVRLAVPEGGVVLDPFAGSGTTGIAALLEGRQFLGIEREPAYVDVACARLAHWSTREQA